jgi:hypothetical protein
MHNQDIDADIDTVTIGSVCGAGAQLHNFFLKKKWNMFLPSVRQLCMEKHIPKISYILQPAQQI